MSDRDEAEEVPEVQEPPVMVTKEQITKGLSRIQRTHGKLSLFNLMLTWLNYFFRWQFVCFCNIDDWGVGTARGNPRTNAAELRTFAALES